MTKHSTLIDVRDIPAHRYATQRERALKLPYIAAWKRQLTAIAAVQDFLLTAAIITRKDIRGKTWQEATVMLRPPHHIAVMIALIITAKAKQADLYPFVVEIGQWAENLLLVPNAPTKKLGRWTRPLTW